MPTLRRCRTCNSLIYFAKTEAGRWTPVNIDGTPHWATCNKPDAHRHRPPGAGVERQQRLVEQQT